MPKASQRKTPETPHDESFVSNYVGWQSPALEGRRRDLDTALSTTRGMNIEAGLEKAKGVFAARAAKTSNNPAVREGAQKDLEVAHRLSEHPDVYSRPTGINDISKRYGAVLGTAVGRGIEEGTETPGTGWYFQHRRGQEGHIDPSADLHPRQVTAMGAKLSSGKTPEDETVAMGGITRLTHSLKNHIINNQRVSSVPSPELAKHASAAAAHGAYEDYQESGRKSRPPTADKPVASDKVYTALRHAGRGHESNVATSVAISRGEITPKEGFGEGTPKTSAYAEMQAQSHPDSPVELDYKGIASHYQGIQAGTHDAGQGMFQFSQEHEGLREHALRPDAPTAIDTWMVAIGSGQPMQDRHPTTGRAYSPAKRLVDSDFPLEPGAVTKTDLGLKGTPSAVTGTAAVSAQHNEAIRRLSMNTIGAVSHDQHGQPIHLPSSHIQETVWTEGRRQAGWDPAWNEQQREKTHHAKVTSRDAARAERERAKSERPLF